MKVLVQCGALVFVCLAAGCQQTPQPVITDRFYQADGRPVWAQPRYTDQDRRKSLHGTARYWYRSGGPRDCITYQHGIPHGKWTHWYDKGPKAFTCRYRQGVLHGVTVIWDRDAEEVCRGVYEHGMEREGSFYRPAPEGSGPAYMAGKIVTIVDGRVVSNARVRDLPPPSIVALRVFWERTQPSE